MRLRPVSLLALAFAACNAPTEPVVSPEGAVLPGSVLPGSLLPGTALPGTSLEATVGLEGLELEDGVARVGLRTSAWGRASASARPDLLALGEAAPVPDGCFATPDRLQPATCLPQLSRSLPGVTEHWAADRLGVRQAWTLHEAPPGAGPVEIQVEVTGGSPWLDGENVAVDTASGTWRYAGLHAWDDRGRALPAELDVDGDTIVVRIDDTDAVWPLFVDPIFSTAGTTLTESSTDFGIGVSLGGDVNNDGYADALVGARFGISLYGQAFSYHGSASGVSTTESRSWLSTAYYGKFGEYLDNTGDLNGDGRDDAVVSTFYDEQFTVYLGSSTGLGASAAATVSGAYGLGRGVAIVGDWNADGYDDLLLGAQEPGAYFYKGSSSGINSTLVTSYATVEAPSVNRAGDVNSDGYDDAIYGDSGADTAYVVRGSASFPGTVTTLTRSGSSNFGYDVAGGGDLNGDGYDDVVVSDPGYNGNIGRVLVYTGSSSGVSAARYTTISSPATTPYGFGSTVELVKDVNGDGYDDLLVADDYDGSYVYLYHGGSGGVATSPTQSLNIGNANFGYSMSGRGDANGDGYNDVLLGTIGSTAYVYYGCPDSDGDGECTDLDCDDTDATINTSATEVCDGVDNDCDGDTDDADSSLSASGRSTFYRDVDGDSYGTSTTTTSACAAPTGYVANATDCNDSSSTINPGATDTIGDGVDSDCNTTETCYIDSDRDTYRSTSTVLSADADCADAGEALATAGADCDDSSASIYPGATELAGDSVDQSCDGAELCYADADTDGYRLATTISSTDADCADPGEALTTASLDCDDADTAVNPAATEVCNGLDDDCDGRLDDADPTVDPTSSTTWYTDSDGDGYGDPAATTLACGAPSGTVSNAEDCDDTDNGVYPGATEAIGDGLDSDCDGLERCQSDDDADGYTDGSVVEAGSLTCTGPGEADASAPAGDCDDLDSGRNPGATETPGDAVDADCDGLERCYDDTDGDGYRTELTHPSASLSCAAAGDADGSVPSADCDDTAAAVNPGATEVCGGLDDDCDGAIDDDDAGVDVSGGTVFYADLDGDGYGLDTGGQLTCDQPAGYARVGGDCDDTAAAVRPGALDLTGDSLDSDCDGAETCYVDADSDGFSSGAVVASADTDCDDLGEATSADPGGDCDDAAPGTFPGAPDPDYDGIDQDCGGITSDLDGDGYDAVEAGGDDCDDADANIHPGATETWYDGIDADCDEADDYDADADGFDDPAGGGDDCDDADPAVYPGAAETWYDGIDADCDGANDYDADNDGFDDPSGGGDDCDDTDAAVNPGATETWYDGTDADCSGASDYDADNDGFDDPSGGGDDCDDTSDTVYPGAAELDDRLDNDCDGHDEGWDADSDGLTDLDEADLGTFPNDADSDDDGLDDGDEVGLGTDPLDPDSDDGGVDDGGEVDHGTDPLDGKDDFSFLPDDGKADEGGCGCDNGGGAGAGALGLVGLVAVLRRRRGTGEAEKNRG